MSLRRRDSHLLFAVLSSLFALNYSTPALSANCSASGGLHYLGNSKDGSHSIWLSGTSLGDFQLDASQGNQTVDAWNKSRRGLRLTRSPVVSNGNGGTHKLYSVEAKNCLLATQNQQGGGLLPPGFNRPPGGLMPELPGTVRPPIGILPKPPAGVKPPIATLPPQGLTPQVPGGVTPPIGTLPPLSGITPEVPGGVTPPIGTLPPPSGITPEVPGGVTPPIGTLPPPSGITPEVPGGVTPPIGTLPPPSGITPEVPGGVTPPIGTLPPPSGITPEVPGGATPPIGTLPPPSGITPEVPGGVTPPIGTLPPPSGITPEVPGGVTPPIGTLPPAGGGTPETPTVTAPGGVITSTNTVEQLQLSDNISNPCGELQPETLYNADPQYPFNCDDYEYDTDPAGHQLATTEEEEAPLTPGRDLVDPSPWNFWADARTTDTSDERHELDMDGYSHILSLGLDRKIGDNFVAGMSLSGEMSRTTGFSGFLQVDTLGYTVSPYLAYRLSQDWVVDISAGVGFLEYEQDIVTLSSDYGGMRYSFATNLSGQYQFEEFNLRPKAGIFYSSDNTDSYDLSGEIQGLNLDIPIGETHLNTGVVSVSTEINKVFVSDGGTTWVPFGEVGVNYAFERPYSGQMVGGDLTVFTPKPWDGFTRAGVRALATDKLSLEGSVGYLSLGQKDLDTWEYGLFLSYAF